MPNWVVTNIVATEPQKIREALVNEAGEVDFNILRPQPTDLDISAGSMSFDTNMPVFLGVDNYPIIPTLMTIYNSTISQDEFAEQAKADERLVKEIISFKKLRADDMDSVDTFVRGFFNHKRYGHVDWYEWRRKNWGTKWNAKSSGVTDDFITFETAWSAPWHILEELAKICPIRVAWADEDLGSNCGMVDLFVNEAGEVEEKCIFDESDEIARVIWGYADDEYYLDEDESEEETNAYKSRLDEFQTQFDNLMNVETLQKDFVEV